MKLITRFTFFRIFSVQCLCAALSTPVFGVMYKDFGAHLPWVTQFVIATWPYWALVAMAMLIATLVIARQGRASLPIIYCSAGGGIFILAQFLTISLLLPIFSFAPLPVP